MEFSFPMKIIWLHETGITIVFQLLASQWLQLRTIDHFTWGLATAIYVAMVTPILYDNSYSLNDSNLKYESYRPYG